MSKKIILEITPEVARKIQDFLTSAEKIAPDEADAWDQIVQQLDGNLERSVSVWHDPETDRPDDNKHVLLLLKSGEVKTDWTCVNSAASEERVYIYHDLDSTDWDDVYAWAYLPEGGEE